MSNDEEENVAEEKVTEEETETKDEEKEEEKGDTGRRCHARMSVVSRQQQKIDADVYMAKKSIGEILQWITIEVLTSRPAEPIGFIRELFKDESLDLDSIREVNNAGISILRNSLSRENEKLRATVRRRILLLFSLHTHTLLFLQQTHKTSIFIQNALTKEEEDELDHVPSSAHDDTVASTK